MTKKLSPQARHNLELVDKGQAILIVPVVVLTELFMVIEKGRRDLPSFIFTAIIRNWQMAENVHLTSLDAETVISSAQLTAILDIFDRLIVAEARIRQIPIITRDPVITASNLAQIIW